MRRCYIIVQCTFSVCVLRSFGVCVLRSFGVCVLKLMGLCVFWRHILRLLLLLNIRTEQLA